MKGFGVAKDATEGVKWIRKAAERGLPIAQYDLGMSYIDGTGVARDLHAAKLWLSRAQDNGYTKASRVLLAVEEVITLSETKSALESVVKEFFEIKKTK
jgi:TPR repeat protein